MALDDLIDEINAGEDRDRAERDEFVLDGMSVPAASAQATDTSRFEQKLTIGDYGKDSDQLMSSWILTSHVGGAMLQRHTEGATDQRFRWARAWTLNPEQLALPPRVRNVALSTVSSIASGDGDANGVVSTPLIETYNGLHVGMGKDLYTVTAKRYALESVSTTYVGALGGYPRGRAADIGRQYIELLGEPLQITGFMVPLGEDGVQLCVTYPNGSTSIEDLTADVKAMAVTHFGGAVYALTTDGYLRRYLGIDSYVEWEAENEDLRLPYGEQPRNITTFYDRSGNETVFICTDRRVWAYDPEAVQIYPVLAFPAHHNNGLGFTVWRDDALYISTGFGIIRYSRDGVRTDVGLDRDNGIPPEQLYPHWGNDISDPKVPVRSRTIVDLIPAQNYLLATVALGGDGTEAGYAIMAWNEAGWHVLVEDTFDGTGLTDAVAFPGPALITDTTGGHRLWWFRNAQNHDTADPSVAAMTTQAGAYTIALPRSFHGPKHQVLEHVEEFADSGYLYTGWFDAGMLGFEKSWSHAEITLVDPDDGLPLSGSVTLAYRTEDDPATWYTLGTASDYGRHVFPFGVDGEGFPAGEASTEIEFRLTLATTDNERSPIIESFILKFIKLPLPGRAWMFHVPLDSENLRGMGPQEIADALSRKTYSGTFSKLHHQGRVARTRVAQFQMVEGVGDMPYKTATVNMIEVPIPGYSPWDGEPEND